MAFLYLNSYVPLAASRAGLAASAAHQLAPFIDGSIRREPDFEHPRPAITCLCRAGKFAPRLRVGDVVVYLTRKGQYGQEPHRRLSAVLGVTDLIDGHEQAAAWYRARSVPLPSNIMVEGNPPSHVSRSHRITALRHEDDDRLTQMWDLGYRQRARQYPRVVACQLLFRELGWHAPIVHDIHLEEVFGAVPGTQNPGAHDLTLLPTLLQRLGISALPSSP